MELVRMVTRGSSNTLAYKLLHLAAILIAIPGLNGCDTRPVAQAATTGTPVPATPSSTETPNPPNPPKRDLPPQPFRTSGPLVAEQQSDVAAEIDGRVARIDVQIGDRVRQGQVLASLDDRALRVAVDAQTARLTSLRAQVAEWESEAKMDGADLRRADQMRDAKIMSEESWEHVKYKLDEVIAEVARYRADETATESDLEAAKLKLGQTRLVAPFSGVVGRESLRLAQEVKKGDVLFWVTAEAPLRILFTVPESEMAHFPPGSSLDLTTPNYPGLHQQARILRVSPVVDPASDSIQVVGAVTQPSALLKPGMSMQVSLATPAGSTARSTPR